MDIETLCRHSVQIAYKAMDDYKRMYRAASLHKDTDAYYDMWDLFMLVTGDGTSVEKILNGLSSVPRLDETYTLNDLGMFRLKYVSSAWDGADMAVSWYISKNRKASVKYTMSKISNTEMHYTVTVRLERKLSNGLERSSSIEYKMTGHPVIPLTERVNYLSVYMRHSVYEPHCVGVEYANKPILTETPTQSMRIAAKFTVPLSTTPIHHPLDASFCILEAVVNRPTLMWRNKLGSSLIDVTGLYRAGVIKYCRNDDGLELVAFSMSGSITTDDPSDYDSVRRHIERIQAEQEKLGIVIMPEEDMVMMRLQYGC